MKFGRCGCREKNHQPNRFVVTSELQSSFWTNSLDDAMLKYKEFYKEDENAVLRDMMMDREFKKMQWDKKQDITKWAGGDNN